MQNQGPERKLEAFKIFPYVAWMLIIFFALFVYKVTTELKSTATELDQTTSSLETTVKIRNNDTTIDFEQ
jgi:hypothetical protein